MIKPIPVELQGDSLSLVNFIRGAAGTYYADMVPVAKSDGSNLKEIGNIICNNPTLANTFINTLVNRIGLTLIKSRMYENPWRRFKKGILEYGETIEEIFVDLCKPFNYDVDVAEQKIWEKENPDVKTNFLLINYEIYYKQTTQDYELEKAFLTSDGVKNLVYAIIDSMYKSMNYDEFLIMKYVLVKQIMNGNIKTVQIPEISNANMKAIAAKMQEYSDKFEFLTRDYNIAGVANDSAKSDQSIILTPEMNGIMNVEVLAFAFNMNKADVEAKKILIDSFSDNDWERLKVLTNNANVEIDDSVKAELDKIGMVLLDDDFLQIWDKIVKFKEIENGQGLYWNHWLHNWKIVGVSTFANCVVFTTDAASVTTIKVEPDGAYLLPGQSLQMTAEVTTSMFADQNVTWSVPNGVKATINDLGKLTIKSDATAGTLTVTATSVFDSTVTGTTTINIVVPE